MRVVGRSVQRNLAAARTQFGAHIARQTCTRSFKIAAGFDLFKAIGLKPSEKGSWVRSASMGCQVAPKEAPAGLELATFAGGCFWGLELKFQREAGVVKTSVGYTGGSSPNPTYEAVCSGMTGHTEAVQVTFDPKETTFTRLLEALAEQIDMTTLNRQGSDRGTQYRSGVYYHSEEQKAAIDAFYGKLNAELSNGSRRGWSGKEVVSEAAPVGDYYIAEGYHQQYLSKGGRFGMAQSAQKGCEDKIRCYG